MKDESKKLQHLSEQEAAELLAMVRWNNEMDNSMGCGDWAYNRKRPIIQETIEEAISDAAGDYRALRDLGYVIMKGYHHD